jgi:hypothetical protein
MYMQVLHYKIRPIASIDPSDSRMAKTNKKSALKDKMKKVGH